MKRIRALRIIIFPAIFTLIGGTCGWLYFRFAGCASGACAIASSPWLTVLFGAAVIGVPVSSWLYLTVAFFSLYMGFGKRRGDARSASAATVYTPVFLERAMQLCLTLALVFYSLWSAGAGLAGSRMLWTVPLAVCICLKYAGDLDAGAEGDPVELLLHDRVLLLLSLAFTVLVLLLLYL